MPNGINTGILNNLIGDAIGNQLAVNQSNLSNTILQLSTGLRINTPADDVAGNAISQQLNQGLAIQNQGSLNAQDAISVAQVAQGGLGQIMDLLQQMSSLATEASNASLNSTDRSDIQTQINTILGQINEVVSSTTFNGQELLNGNIAGTKDAVDGSVAISSNSYIGAVGNSLISGFSVTSTVLDTANDLEDEVFQFVIQASTSCSNAVQVVVFSSNQGSGGTVSIANAQVAISGTQTVVGLNITSAASGAGTVLVSLNFTGIETTDIQNMIGESAFLQTQAYQSAVDTNNSLQIQVGSTLGQVIEVNAPQVTTGVLFSSQDVNVGTSMEAQGALNQISHAINILTTAESTIAAEQDQFNDQVSQNQVQTENMTASLSRIQDVNVAQATTTLATQQILVQTATSMLGQANLLPQSITKLFP